MRSSNNYSTSLFCVLADPRETRRVDTYLSALFPEKSRSYIQKMIEEGKIRANGEHFTKNKKIYRWDVIEMNWIIEDMKLIPQNIPIDIIFENDDFAIINKDAGMNTHPTPGEEGRKGSLVNALLYHFKNLWVRNETGFTYDEEGDEIPQEDRQIFAPSIINWVERPGIVHRLDKDTSGVIIIAKNDKSMQALQLKIAKRTIQKTYLALVIGIIPEKEGYIESFIGRDPWDRKKMTTTDPLNPKLAKTKFYNRGIFHEKYTLVEVDLLTGRTHQIRVHLASIGYPILWDKVYGRERENITAQERYGLTRQWLHAWKLHFILFWTHFSFIADLKKDLKIVTWDIHI
jgi:23S rRNA pseudouridine1911/1915/1917 synthase